MVSNIAEQAQNIRGVGIYEPMRDRSNLDRSRPFPKIMLFSVNVNFPDLFFKIDFQISFRMRNLFPELELKREVCTPPMRMGMVSIQTIEGNIRTAALSYSKEIIRAEHVYEN